MIVGSNPGLSNVILGLKISFMCLKTQKGIFICPKLMPKAKKFNRFQINSELLQTNVLIGSLLLGPSLSQTSQPGFDSDLVRIILKV